VIFLTAVTVTDTHKQSLCVAPRDALQRTLFRLKTLLRYILNVLSPPHLGREAEGELVALSRMGCGGSKAAREVAAAAEELRRWQEEVKAAEAKKINEAVALSFRERPNQPKEAFKRGQKKQVDRRASSMVRGSEVERIQAHLQTKIKETVLTVMSRASRGASRVSRASQAARTSLFDYDSSGGPKP
jgi:hypothetical protein